MQPWTGNPLTATARRVHPALLADQGRPIVTSPDLPDPEAGEDDGEVAEPSIEDEVAEDEAEPAPDA
jgi:hypothetical protein